MGGGGSFVRRKRSGGWEGTEHLYGGNGAENERCLIICTMLTGRRMGGNESFVRRNRSRGWEMTDRLYEGSRAGYE